MPAAKQAGVPWIGFHTLRHTCASLLFEQGAISLRSPNGSGMPIPAFTLRTYVHLMDEGGGGALSVDGIGAASADTLAQCPPQAVKAQTTA